MEILTKLAIAKKNAKNIGDFEKTPKILAILLNIGFFLNNSLIILYSIRMCIVHVLSEALIMLKFFGTLCTMSFEFGMFLIQMLF